LDRLPSGLLPSRAGALAAVPALVSRTPASRLRHRQARFFSSLERHRDPKAFAAYLAPVRQTEWVVYAKPPFGGPEQVLNYLGRYTHRVAISNNRLLNIDHGKVAFRWKDYRHQEQQKTMTLAADEFIRRFLLHVLPEGFQRIRHYGLLGHRYRQAKLALCRQLLGVAPALTSVSARQEKSDYRDVFEKLTGQSLRECPVCHRGQMVTIAVLSPSDRAPPFVN
jgi:Putative transposase